MRAADIPAVLRIADRVHPDYPEDEAVFVERLRLAPEGCFVLEMEGAQRELIAYLVSHPWLARRPPALNSQLLALPELPETFYIHDIALLPQARGSGAASSVVGQLAGMAKEAGYGTLSLVAVNGSTAFWRRHGFAEIDDPALAHKLRSYDDEAVFMERALG